MGAISGVRVDDNPLLSRAIAGLRWMVTQGVDDPVVTLGARGVVHRRDDAIMLARCPVAEPRVAVAAGDAFVAGYCVAVSGQRSTKVETIDLAVASAAEHVAGDIGLTSVEERIAWIDRAVLESL